MTRALLLLLALGPARSEDLRHDTRLTPLWRRKPSSPLLEDVAARPAYERAFREADAGLREKFRALQAPLAADASGGDGAGAGGSPRVLLVRWNRWGLFCSWSALVRVVLYAMASHQARRGALFFVCLFATPAVARTAGRRGVNDAVCAARPPRRSACSRARRTRPRSAPRSPRSRRTRSRIGRTTRRRSSRRRTTAAASTATSRCTALVTHSDGSWSHKDRAAADHSERCSYAAFNERTTASSSLKSRASSRVAAPSGSSRPAAARRRASRPSRPPAPPSREPFVVFGGYARGVTRTARSPSPLARRRRPRGVNGGRTSPGAARRRRDHLAASFRCGGSRSSRREVDGGTPP